LVFSGYKVDSVHERLEVFTNMFWPTMQMTFCVEAYFANIRDSCNTQSCKQILGENFGVEMLLQKAESLSGLESLVQCKILILTWDLFKILKHGSNFQT